MKTASFIVKFILALVIIVILFFVAVAGIGIYKGMTTDEVLRAIGDASIFTKEFWTQTGGVAGIFQRWLQ